MIGYTTLGTNDFDKAVAFYDEVLACFGAQQMVKNDRICIWTDGSPGGMVSVCKPYDEQPATVGNGVMIALNGGNKEKVQEVYEKALSLGATSEGEPGFRGDGDIFYGAYFRDLDGNKLAVYFFNM